MEEGLMQELVHDGSSSLADTALHCTRTLSPETMQHLLLQAPHIGTAVLDSEQPIQPYWEAQLHSVTPYGTTDGRWGNERPARRHSPPLRSLQGCEMSSANLHSFLSKCANLRHLHLHHPGIDDALLTHTLQALTALTYLSLRRSKHWKVQGDQRVRLAVLLSASKYGAWMPASPMFGPTSKGLTAALPALTNLKHLDLVLLTDANNIAGTIWQDALSGLTQLTYLSLPRASPHTFASWLTRLRELRELVAIKCNEFESEPQAYAALSSLNGLTSLTIHGVQNSQEVDEGVPALPAQMPRYLCRLDVPSTWINVRTLKSQFPCLTHCYPRMVCRGIDDARRLSELASLQHLQLQVFSTLLLNAVLTGLTSLTRLHLHRLTICSHRTEQPLNGRGVRAQGGAQDLKTTGQRLTHLKELELEDCSVNVCQPLLLPHLTKLAISSDDNQVWDESCLTALSNMTALQMLMLQGYPAVGALLQLVSKLPELHTLCMYDLCKWGDGERVPAYEHSLLNEMVRLTRLEGFNMSWKLQDTVNGRKEGVGSSSRSEGRGEQAGLRPDHWSDSLRVEKSKREAIEELKALIRKGWGKEWGEEWQKKVLAELEAGQLPGSYPDTHPESWGKEQHEHIMQQLSGDLQQPCLEEYAQVAAPEFDSKAPASACNTQGAVVRKDPFLQLLEQARGLRHLHITITTVTSRVVTLCADVLSDMDNLLIAAAPHLGQLRTLHIPGCTEAVVPHLTHLESLEFCQLYYDAKPCDVPEQLVLGLKKLPQLPAVVINDWVVE